MAQPIRSRTAQRKRDLPTRERMLDVALEAFSELGFDGASTRTIASRAGVNQGMIPYYFGSKEALWREAVDRAFAECRAYFDELLEGESVPADRLPELVRGLVRFVARKPAFARLMSEEGKRDGKRLRWIVDRHVRPLFESTRELRRDSSAGPHHDALRYYLLVGAATQIYHNAPECRLLTGVDPSEDALIEAHADALIALFAPESQRRTP